MAQEPDSYGTPEGVAAYVGVYTLNGAFTTDTQPTLATVVRWIDQVSDVVNVALSDAGFTPPIANAVAFAAISMWVEQLVADLVHAANSKGRLITKSGSINYSQIDEDILAWVRLRAIGFVNLGVPRTQGTIGVIATRDVDATGEPAEFIFSRSDFGNSFEARERRYRNQYT